MQPGQRIQGRQRRLQALWLGAGLLLGGLASALANWDFALILQNAESRYGSLGAAKQRIEAWDQLIKASGNLPETDKLTEVNRFFNRQINFVDDSRVWQQVDYWATPVEALVKGAGDCEDYSIAKYFLLKELGVPIARLRLTYVNAIKLGQAHMVLAYYPRPDAEPLVLDNLDPAVRPASQRTDLVPVYSFNDDEVWIETRGRSGSPRQIRNWSSVIERLEQEARL